MNKSSKDLQTNTRDIEIFLFVWRWKVVTTHAIIKKFFPGLNPVTAYNRLSLLKKADLLQIRSINNNASRFVWTITKKSFDILKSHLPELKEEGFGSEYPEHDFYASAIHLGEWLVDAPKNVDFFSEQELRRCYTDHYPPWVPKDHGRRPDGYWRVPYNNGFFTIALEVELSVKKNSKYDVVAQFYKDNPRINRVVWVVRTPTIARHIQDKLRNKGEEISLKHNFVILRDIESLNWHASIYLGYEKGKTLGYVLGSHTEKSQRDMKVPLKFMRFSLLDARKCPFDSRRSQETEKSQVIDRMAYRPYLHLTQSKDPQIPNSNNIIQSNNLPLNLESNSQTDQENR